MKPINSLPPFKRFCVTIGNLPSSYVDSMSYYECVMWLCKYLKDTVIPTVNENAEAVNELINWFNNLDVQDEVNNKLDEMAEDGTLSNLINVELFNGLNNKIESLEKDSKSLKGNYVSMQNYIIYDFNDTEYSQGSCIGDGGNIFVYKSNTNYNGGTLLVFNNEVLTSSINVNLYHGNCLTYLNGKIYSTGVNKKIVSYELNTGIRLELDPFENVSEYNLITGISKYDENHLICHLYNESGMAGSSSNNTMYILDVRDNSFVELPLTNTKGLYVNYYAVQGMCYKNNHIYVLSSYPNMVYDYVVNNGIANLDKTFIIPLRDELGLLIGEVEDISPSGTDGTFLLTSHTIDHDNSYKTLMTHFISFDYELDPVRYQYIDTDVDYEGYRQALYIDNNKSGQTLYEDGSSSYPFKTLRRGLVSANYGKYYHRHNVVINGNGAVHPYSIGTIYGINDLSLVDVNDKVCITGTTTLINCNITINVTDNDNFLFDTLILKNTRFNSVNHRLEISQYIDVADGSDAMFYTIKQTNTGNIIPLYVRTGCKCQIYFSGGASVSSNTVIDIFGNGLCIANMESSRVTLETAQGVYIKLGQKIG